MTARSFALLLVSAWFTAGCSKSSPSGPPLPSGPGTIEVHSIPGSATASVIVNSATTTAYTPAQFSGVDAGPTAIELRLLGYADTTVTVVVAPQAYTVDTVALRPLSGTPRSATEIWSGFFNYPGPLALGSDGYFRVTASVNFVPTFVLLAPNGAIQHQVVIPDVNANPAFDIALDSNDRAYVASDALNGAIFVFDHVGNLQTSIGRRSTSDGHVSGIAIGPGDTLHVSARFNEVGVVEKYTTGGVFLYAFSTGVTASGPIEVDATGNVYVCAGSTPQVRKYSRTGVLLQSWSTADWPQAVSRGPNGLYVACAKTSGDRERAPAVMQVFNSSGALLAQWAMENQGLAYVQRFAVASDGALYVPMHNDRRVLRYGFD